MEKTSKKQLWVFIVIVLFFGSTIAFAVMQALGFTPQQEQQYTTIPDERIFDKENEQLENLFIRYGYTVAKLNYDGTCCQDVIQYLESVAGEADSKMALFKLVGNETLLKITGFMGIEELNGTKITKENTFSVLCRTMKNPPIECGFLLVKNQTNATR